MNRPTCTARLCEAETTRHQARRGLKLGAVGEEGARSNGSWYSPSGEYLSRQAASLTSNFLVKCQKAHIPARVGWVRSWGSAVEHRTFSGPAERTWLHIYILTCRLGARVLCVCVRAMQEVAVHTRLCSSLKTSASCVPEGVVFFVAGELELRVDVDSEVIACVDVDIRVVGCACGVPARPA